MLFELLASAMINPDVNKMNLIAVTNTKTNIATVKTATAVKWPYTQSYLTPMKNKTPYANFYEVTKHYASDMSTVVKDFKARKNDTKQFLKWVDLPTEQMTVHGTKSHLDEIYEQATELKSRKDKVDRPLVVLGIGGSKHTAEFLLNMNGLGNKGKVYFYSDIDPISFSNFLKEVNHPVQDLNFLVVSKSGTTFETKDAFTRFENMLVEYYQKHGLNEAQAKTKAQSHFAICTDKTATKANLRGKIGHKNGKDNSYIKELYIHDGVGGRFSMFDDAGLFVNAYAGFPKAKAVRMLKSAEKMSGFCLNENASDNPAGLAAIFNVYSRDYGYKLTQQQYFGHLFETSGENWIKQLYLESLKDFDFVSSKAPDSMHYASEGFFYPQNRDKYHMVMTIMTPDISENYRKYVSAVLVSYLETAPVGLEILEVENGAIRPEAIGEYVQSKHFETVYTGMLRRQVAITNTEKLPEVFQPHVEVYKNKFKPNSKFELAPGK